MRIISKSKQYIYELKNLIPIKNSKDVHKIDSLYKTYTRLNNSKKKLSWLRILLYALLYASILSSMTIVLGLQSVLSGILDVLFTITSITGTTLSVILIVVLTNSINNYDNDIKTIESHIISIYVKHDKSSEETFAEFQKKYI